MSTGRDVMTNATLKKFGDPHTRVKAYDTWVLVLRPQQITLGAMVLVSSENATAFSELSREAFVELQGITREIETGLQRAFAYDKINYLMLMMVDPDVHFHVIPRYADSKVMADCTFYDYGWPGPPELSHINETTMTQNQQIIAHMKDLWD